MRLFKNNPINEDPTLRRVAFAFAFGIAGTAVLLIAFAVSGALALGGWNEAARLVLQIGFWVFAGCEAIGFGEIIWLLLTGE